MFAIPQSISRTFFQLLFLLLILESRIVSTWFTRSDMLWDDSSWLEDVIGVGVGGIGALYDILDKMTDTEVQPTVQSPSLSGNPLDPLSVPSSMKKCSAPRDGAPGGQFDEGVADAGWDLVKQDPVTGLCFKIEKHLILISRGG